ncbi:MAG: hypothetical protein HY287_02500 [Planctomycetes bacterium]|nr:hypothetical protein [Planctomycetota bacterium]MBI3833180.1 hypothetical protein [Planctomycetota bacterium]
MISAKATESRRSPSSVASHRDIRRAPESSRQRRQATQSVTLRLRELIARNLRRASIERTLGYEQPYTQQAITEAALTAWLERNGYSIEE